MASLKQADSPVVTDDALAQLSDLLPRCEIRTDAYVDPCGVPAVWAVRTHSSNPQAKCPKIALICDEHLEGLRSNLQGFLKQLTARGSMYACLNCRSLLRTIDDLLWDIERIRP